MRANLNIFPGARLRVAQTADGSNINVSPRGAINHAWKTLPKWSPKLKAWVATVTPGLVINGTPRIWPIYATQTTSAPQVTLLRAKKTANSAQPIDVPIFDSPLILLDSFRALGFDGTGGASVPAFFAALGVGAAPKTATDSTVIPTQKSGNRLLRACDIVVRQPRYALQAQATVGSAVVTGFTLIQTLSIAAPAPSQRLQILASAASDSSTGIDPLTGDYTEPTWDDIVVSTVYLVSPVNTTPGSTPDRTWRAYVQHSCFWNLAWAQLVDVTDPALPPLTTFIPTIIGAIAQPLINSLLAPVNDAVNASLDQLAAHSLAGSFWSIGGSAALPVPPVPTAASTLTGVTSLQIGTLQTSGPLQTSDGFGFSKNDRLAAAAAANNKRPDPLDPAWPYAGQRFPLNFLS